MPCVKLELLFLPKKTHSTRAGREWIVTVSEGETKLYFFDKNNPKTFQKKTVMSLVLFVFGIYTKDSNFILNDVKQLWTTTIMVTFSLTWEGYKIKPAEYIISKI